MNTIFILNKIMTTPAPPQSQLPTPTSIVDTMVATTLCKSLGEGISGKLTAKNIGYLVLLSSIPDIKKMILDSIHVVKEYLLNNFKTVISGITQTQLYQLISWIWRHSFGYLLKILKIKFRGSPELTTSMIMEPFVPIQPQFKTEFQVDFKDNIQVVQNMIDLLKKSDHSSSISSIDLINKSQYSYIETLSDLSYKQDELLIRLNDQLKLSYESKDGQISLMKFNGIDFATDQQRELADKLGLTLTEKPSTPKKFTDMMDNRLIAAFMDSEDYQNFSKAANHIGMINLHKIRLFSSVYNFDFTDIYFENNYMLTPLGKIFYTLFKLLNITSVSEKYRLFHDIIIYTRIFDIHYEFNLSIIKDAFEISSLKREIVLKCKVKSSYYELYYTKNINTIGKDRIISDLDGSMDKPLYLFNKIDKNFKSISNFVSKKDVKSEKINTIVNFTLSSLNPSLDLVSTFQSNFLEPLSKSVKSDNNKKITVYSVKIDTIKTISTKPNPDYAKYQKRKREIEQMIEKTKDTNHGKLLGKFASIDIPDEEIEVVETEDNVICTRENTLSKPFDTLYLRKEDEKNLTSILNNFKNCKEIYERLGLCRKIGIMLYGDPGTGKSTTIISTATYLEYDIYYVSISNIETNAQFKMIIDHINDKTTRGGIIVMEDIDAQSIVFHKRSSTTSPSPLKEDTIIDLTERVNDKLDLSYILNMFDGALSRENNVFMFTTNHIEKIDPAVYRTGRIHSLIHLKRCNHYQIKIIYNSILKREITSTLLNKIPIDRWTPADIIFHLVKYYYQPDATDDEIMNRFIEE